MSAVCRFRVFGFIAIVCSAFLLPGKISGQINTEQVMTIGKNALYFEDYILSIQYFNQVISVKPYLADPYFFRGVAKFYLEDYKGAESDCSLAIERNPFIVDAYQVRGISRQILNDNEGAIEDYNVGLEYLPEDKTFLLNKAIAQQNIKDYKGSAETFRALLSYYPKYDNAYLGLAELQLVQGDTVAALDNISKCIELNSNNSDAFVMRAGIWIKNKENYKNALEDMDAAIKLQPKQSDFFVNRAFLKYNLDDYFGAMADFDYAISLDPANMAAHLNRGLLRMEVEDNNKAIEDFTFVIDKDPDNYMAIYNRAMLYQKTGQYDKSIADFDRVIEKYPDIAMVYFDRSESKRLSGDMKGGERDYYKSRELSREMADNRHGEAEKAEEEKEDSPAAVMKRFKTMVAVESGKVVKPEYDNKYRGKVQNYNAPVNLENEYILSYYDRISELRTNAYYQKELDELNSSHYLRDKLYITNVEPKLTEEQIQTQFSLIRHYSSLLSSSDKRPVDFFGRAVSYFLVKNYDAAIDDLSKAAEMSPQFVLAYFARAMARYERLDMEENARAISGTSSKAADGLPDVDMLKERQEIDLIVADFDKVIELSPNLIYAYFNKGNLYAEKHDYTSAISCFTEAINIKSDFGEAFYNRGMMYLQLGNMEKGVADLSKAGELGILSSYYVLKRMRR